MCCKSVKIGCECDLDTTCLKYNGRCLDFIGVRDGDTLNDILSKLNYELQNISFKSDNGFIVKNVGNKIPIYKGISYTGIEEFKTISVGKGVKLVDDGDVLTFGLDEEYVKNVVLEYLNEINT